MSEGQRRARVRGRPKRKAAKEGAAKEEGGQRWGRRTWMAYKREKRVGERGQMDGLQREQQS